MVETAKKKNTLAKQQLSYLIRQCPVYIEWQEVTWYGNHSLVNFGGSSGKVAASATPIAESKLFARESPRIAISAVFYRDCLQA